MSGLKEKLRDRQAVEVYLRAYNAERRRLVADAVSNRGTIERQIGEVEREYDRAYQGYLKGFVPEDEASVTLPKLRAARDKLRAELAAAKEPPKVVTLHPAAIKAYLASIDKLEVTLAQSAVEGDEEPRKALRDLGETVVVNPPSGDGVVVVGQLTKIVGEKVFPSGTVRGDQW